MKIKKSYITNSSAASFILTVESEVDDLQKFKDLINNYFSENITLVSRFEPDGENTGKTPTQIIIDNRSEGKKIDWESCWKRTPISSSDIMISHKYNNIFEISETISMFNDYDDIPKWMTYLIIDNISGKLKKYNFKLLLLEIDSDN